MKKHTFNNFFLCAMLVPAIVSCKALNYDGNYQVKSTGTFGSEIQLFKDSTFKYSILTDIFGGGTFTGLWKCNRDTLLLQILDPAGINTVIKEEKVNIISNPLIASGNIEILIKAQDSIPLSLTKIYIDDIKSPLITDDNGKVVIKKDKIEKVRIEFNNIVPRQFIITPGNSVEINIYDYEFVPLLYRMVFTKFLYHRKQLIPIDRNGKLLERAVYTRVK